MLLLSHFRRGWSTSSSHCHSKNVGPGIFWCATVLIIFFLSQACLLAVQPNLLQSPLSRTVFQGSNHTFTVMTEGSPPLFFQWRKDEVDLPAQTNSVLSLTNIQPADAGLYVVVVVNASGSVTSAPARLTVRAADAPRYPTPSGGWAYLFSGQSASNAFNASLDGTWNRQNSDDSWDGSGRGPGDGLPGGVASTNGILTLEDAISGGSGASDSRRYYFTHDLGLETAVVTNANTVLNDGITLTFRARLTPPTDPLLELTNAPNGWVNANDGKGMFGIRQSGGNGLLVSFSLNNALEDSSASATFSFNQPGLHMNNLNGNSRSAAVDPGEGGTLNLFPLDPAVFHEFYITIQDNGAAPGTHLVSVYADGGGTPAQFNVTAGSGSDTPFTNYLALGLPSTGQRGAVDIDFFGYKAGAQPPALFNEPIGITSAPANQFLAIGQSANFNVGVTGTPPYAFQWYRNGLRIEGATNASYTTPPVASLDEGTPFTVVVSNEFNSVTSAPPAVLIFLQPPLLTGQPQSLTVTNGDPASFCVIGSSPAPLLYQWQFNGVTLTNETNATLFIASATAARAGNYTAVVANNAGAVTSQVATLTVRFLDYGDAPDPSYPTLKASNGARHLIMPGIYLGQGVDADLEGQPTANALGDDASGADDDDGVIFLTPLRAGQLASLAVVASTNGQLDAWIDFNGDGNWTGAGEQIMTNRFLTAGTNLLVLSVPPTVPAINSFARFRFSTTGGLSFEGPAADGEVEDYAVALESVADLGITVTSAPDPVAVGSNLVYSIVVNNAGPSTASGVILTNRLPAGMSFISASPSQGSCGPVGPVIQCALGTIAAGASANLTIIAAPGSSGLLTNTVWVRSAAPDLNPANDLGVALVTALNPPALVVPPQNSSAISGSNITLAVTATGSAPLTYQWRFNGNDLPGQNNAALLLANVQPTQAGSYSVRVSNAVGQVESASVTLTVLSPPSITASPQNRTDFAGGNSTFSVTATGTAPLGFQWLFNDINPLSGRTNSVLTLTNVQLGQAGSYRVAVSNSAGSILSAPASLTVLAVDFGDAPDPGYPTLLASDGARHRLLPGVALGSRADFEPDGQPNATASGDDSAGVDDEDGITFSAPLAIGQLAAVSIVATTNGFLNAWLDYNRNGSWADPGDQIFTNVALLAGLNVRNILVPSGASIGASYARFRFATTPGLSFTGEAGDGEVEDYRVTIDPAVNLLAAVASQPNPVAVGSNLFSSITVTNAGISDATSVTITNFLPAGVNFVTATASQGGCVNNGSIVACTLGNVLAGAGASALIVVTPAVAGNLSNRVQAASLEADTQPANNVASVIVRALVFPVLNVGPQNQTVTNGGSALFTVSASGTTLRYQWRKNGLDLPNATNATLLLLNVQAADAGAFSVRVTNEVGAVTSGAATLTVLFPVSLISQPQNTMVSAGQTASFSVTAQGTAPLNYQWQFQNADLPDATNATLVISNVQAAQAGAYRVVVANPVRAVLSDSALLTVLSPPNITLPPQSRTNLAGSDATFTVSASGPGPLRYQWRFNQTNLLSGETNVSLTLTNVQRNQAGQYSVVITNGGGMTISAPAVLQVVEVDFGDAPEALGYPTTLIFNGARHRILPGVFLGAGVDPEPDGRPDATATGDDLAGADDEEGVTFMGSLRLGQLATLSVVASTNGFLDGWVDFNVNGTWTESGEQVFASRPLVAGLNILTFLVPATATPSNSFARFRFSTAGGLAFDGWANDGEVEDYAVTIISAPELAVSLIDSVDPVLTTSNLSYLITVTNRGPVSATNVRLTNTLPAGVTFLSATVSQGSCSPSGNSVICSLGALPANSGIIGTILVKTGGPGALFAAAQVGANEVDGDPSDNLATQTTVVIASPSIFRSTTAMAIADATANGPGQGTPYPSTLTVSGLNGAVYRVAVTLSNLTHAFPDDLDFLLVSPGGQAVLLMSDAGGAVPIISVSPILDDDAPILLPNSGAILSQRYRPSNFTPDPDFFPAPAPSTPPAAALSAFRGSNPNGPWSLYAVDDAIGDAGTLAGWSLEITTLESIADLALALKSAASSVALTSNLVYVVTLTNQGPATALAVNLVDTLPAGVNFISATLTGGSCLNETGKVSCAIASIPPFATATLSLVTQPAFPGTITNRIYVSSVQGDFVQSNNMVEVMTSVRAVTDLVVTQSGPTNLFVAGNDLTYALRVTNRGPALATAVRLVDLLPAGIPLVAATSTAGSCVNNAGTLTCDLGNVAAGAGVELFVTVRPAGAGLATNAVTVASLNEIESSPADNSSLLITPINTAADLAVSLSRAPDSIALGSNLTFLLTVTNLGPSSANGVLAQFPLPSGLSFISASALQGSCTNDAGTIRCACGLVPAGGGDQMQIVTVPTALGPKTNKVSVTSAALDPQTSNNTVSLVTKVEQPPVLLVPPQNQTVLAGANASFNVLADGFAPLRYQWQFNDVDLPGATNTTLELSGVSAALTGNYRVRVSNPVGAVLSAPAQLRLNQVPVIAVANASTDEDHPVTVSVSIGDAETPANGLVLSGQSLNTNLLANAGILFGGAGSNRTVLLTPVSDEYGSVPINLTVSDGMGGSNSASFLLVVNPVNDPPTLSPLHNVAVEIDSGPRVVALSGLGPGGLRETQALTMTVSSSVPLIIPQPTLNYVSPNTKGSLTFAPTPGAIGSSTLTVTLYDDGASNNVITRSFIVTVGPADFPPEIASLPDRSIAEDTALVVPVVVNDFENAASLLAVTATSSDSNLVPSASFSWGGSESNRTLRILPATNQFGTATITVQVSDTNRGTASASFLLTVNPVNDPPTLDSLPAVTVFEDSGPRVISLTGLSSGAPNEIQTVTLSATSSDPLLVPNPVVTYRNPETAGTLRFNPATNASGTVTITVILNDGTASNNISVRSFPITILPQNDLPTMSPIAGLTTLEDIPIGAAFQVADAETAPEFLIVTAHSSNFSLLTDANIVLSGTGAVRTIKVNPTPNRSGLATVTVTVTDPSGASSSQEVSLTVIAVADPPTMTPLADRVIDEDSGTGPILFVLGGPDSNPANLTLSGLASNTNLLPTPNMIFGGAGANRTVTLTPAPNQFGSTLVTVQATDPNGLSASQSFRLVINPANDPPTLDAIPNRTVPRNADGQTIPLSGISAGPNEMQQLTLTATSSNPSLIPNPTLTYLDPQTTGTLAFAVMPNLTGTATLTVTVDDGQAANRAISRSFLVTVEATNDPPTLSILDDRASDEDMAVVVPFSVYDDSTPGSALLLSASSSDQTLVPNASISIGGNGSNRFMTILPATNQSGVATINLSARDNLGASSSVSFVLTINPVNDPPLLSDIPNRTLNEDSAGLVLSFTVSDVETPASNLLVAAFSSNLTLLPAANIVLGGGGGDRTITLTPAPHQSGSATVTVVVRDTDGLAASDTFALTVIPVNDPPIFSAIPNVALSEDSTLFVPFVVTDLETAPEAVSVQVVSSNPGLLPSANLLLSGNGANRVLQMTPGSNEFGLVTVTLIADDTKGGTATNSFQVTVNPVNDPPTLAAIPDRVLAVNAGLQTVNLAGIGSGGANENQTLAIVATSSNPSLIPSPTVNYASPNSTGTLSFTPQPGAAGTSAITVTVSDDGSSNNVITRTFMVTVGGANTPPVISDIPDQEINEDAVLTSAFVINDGETSPFNLTLSATSSDVALVASTNIFFDGDGTNRTLRVVPSPDQFGTTLITVTVGDGIFTASDSFMLTVDPVNDWPTLAPLADLMFNGNPGAQSVPLSGISSGATNENQILTVTATTDNPGLFFNVPSISYTSPGGTGTLNFRPNQQGTGTALITVTVRDNGASNNVVTRSMTLYMRPNGNLPPTISTPPNQSIAENGVAGPLPITLTDADTPLTALLLKAVSSNTNLVPNENLVLSGSGGNRFLTVTPTLRQSGMATITLTVIDPSIGMASSSFLITVNAVNDLPTISAIADQNMNEGSSTPVLAFTVSDLETPEANLIVTATSSNPLLVPVNNIVLGGSGSRRALRVTAAAGQSGTSLITLTVADGNGGAAAQSFLVAVSPLNDPPSLSVPSNQFIDEDTATAPLPFTVSDDLTPAANLVMGVTTSNPDLIPLGNILLGGSGNARTVQITPTPNAAGVSLITFNVTDDAGLRASNSFLVTVKEVNDPPTLNPLANLNALQGSGPIAINLSGIGSGSPRENQILAVAATSSNPTLIPDPAVIYFSPASTGTLLLLPNPGTNGVATITVTISDGQPQNGFTSRTFTANVSGLPTISDLPDRVTNEDVPLQIAFTIGDAETPASALTLTATSSDPNLVPAARMVFGGTGNSRTLTVTPATNQFGHATLTVTVRDGSGDTASDSFELIVNPVNDSPTLAPLPDLTLPENAPMQTITLSGITTGAPNENQPMVLRVSSSNPRLILTPTISYTSPAATGTIRFVPNPHSNGVSTITVMVSDGQSQNGSVTQSFRVTIAATNDPPILMAIPDQMTDEDMPIIVGFLASDVENFAGGVFLTASSSNPALVPMQNIQFGGTNGNYSMRIVPAPNRSGATTIAVSVADAAGAVTTGNFVLTVNPINDPPLLGALPDQVTNEDLARTIPFTVDDLETPLDSLILTATSSNPALIRESDIVFAGSGSNRTITLTPARDQFGSAAITVNLTDASGATASRSFLFTVLPVEDAPLISDLPDLLTQANVATPALAFAVSDADTTSENLLVLANSSNATLVPPGHILLGGQGTNRWLVLNPAFNRSGNARITVIVTDGDGRSAQDEFLLTVQPLPGPPLIVSQPQDQSAGSGGSVSFAVVAEGFGPFQYQWQQDGVDLAGATNATLFLNSVQVRDAGNYRVRVSNPSGATWSETATLRVVIETVIVSLVRNGLTAQISFTTGPGVVYTVEYSDRLTLPAWTSLQTVTGTGSILSVNDPATISATRFYRVHIE